MAKGGCTNGDTGTCTGGLGPADVRRATINDGFPVLAIAFRIICIMSAITRILQWLGPRDRARAALVSKVRVSKHQSDAEQCFLMRLHASGLICCLQVDV